MAYLELKNIHKKFGAVEVLKDISLTVSEEEFVAFVGPSGCGKSTLLRMIAGLETIDSGIISIDEIIINNIPPKDRDIAMVFQNYALYPHMSVYENLTFGLRIKGEKKKDYDALIKETAEMLGITDLLDRKPKQLSGGQKQRIAVGRAIVRKPKAFLFDEPLSNLDAKLRVKMRTDLLRIHKQQRATSIYVTHDQIEAMTMADRVVILNKGIIQQADSPLEVYNHPANLFVAGFIGSPAMNFVEGSIQDQDGQIQFITQNGTLLCELPERFRSLSASSKVENIILGIRPEDITIKSKGDQSMPLGEQKVELIEHMGDVSLVHFSFEDAAEWIMKTPPMDEVVHSNMLKLHLDTDRVHLFDAATTLAIEC